MSNAVATIEQDHAPRLPSLQSGGVVRAIVPQDFEGAWRIASAVCKAGMAPRGLDTAEKAMVAILHGLEVGLTPMNALQSIAVINSRATLWGDGALGIVQASGKMSSHKEWIDGEGDKRTAHCVVVRRGDPEPKTGEFSVAEAKKAGLWGKAGPWQQYSDRMLKMRARAFALRDGFSDVLRGLGIAEEVQDIHHHKETVLHDDEPPAPPPVAKVAPPAPAPEPEILPPEPEAKKTFPDVSDTEAFMNAVVAKFAAAKTPEELNDIWEINVEPNKGGLMPPDEDDLMAEYRRFERQLS